MRKKQTSSKLLKSEKNRILVRMSLLDQNSDEYNKLLLNLKELDGIQNGNFQKVGPIIIGAAANIAGIVLVMNYERLNIFTTKAFGLAFKVKSI